jgi:hypothetical protein
VNIVFATTCRGRTEHLRQTLPQNLADNPGSKFVLLNYNDRDDLYDYVRGNHAEDIESGRLVLYSYYDSPVFVMAHAKNMAHRLAMREGADVLVTLDADNYAGYRFEDYLRHKFTIDPDLSYVCPDLAALPPPDQRYNKDNPVRLARGIVGRLAIRAQDFLKAGGYNNKYEVWGGEDIDLLARLLRLGLKRGFIDDSYLNAIIHGAGLRFKEYPHARQYENDRIYKETRNAYDTVVNFGDIGCGEVFRNFEDVPVPMGPVPTRIFGVGFQRTGTSSLHEALTLLGYDAAHWLSGPWASDIWHEMHKWGNSRTLERHYALSDNPIPLLFRELDRAYPGSKFILTMRDEAKWLRSMEKFFSYERNPLRKTWEHDRGSYRMLGITYGRIDFDAETMLARYQRHNWEVREYFASRPDDLLVMDMDAGAGWPELCGFLGRPVPDALYPHAYALPEVTVEAEEEPLLLTKEMALSNGATKWNLPWRRGAVTPAPPER